MLYFIRCLIRGYFSNRMTSSQLVARIYDETTGVHIWDEDLSGVVMPADLARLIVKGKERHG
jgi:hypothetical protein